MSLLREIRALLTALALLCLAMPVVAAPPLFALGNKDCSECPEMAVIPAGRFLMGSSAEEQRLANEAGLPKSVTDRESPQHEVSIRRFAAGIYPVTKGEFAAFVRANNNYQTEAERGEGCFAFTDNEWQRSKAHNWRNVGFAQADDHPVLCVSWNDAKAYAAWISKQSGKPYRLLSEAEREYAARGSKQTAFWWGNTIQPSQVNYDATATSYNGSAKGDWRKATVPARQFAPNPFGLYQVHGNSWDWVEDCFHSPYDGAPIDGSARIDGDCLARVVRGGGWFNNPVVLRSAFRNVRHPGARDSDVGIRLARTLP